MEVVITDTYEQLSRAAAAIVAQVINSKPNAVLGLPTGATPLGLYQELARMHRQEGLDFSRITTFNLDEYVGLPPKHPQSHHYFMHENLFKHINVPQEHTFLPSGTTDNYAAFCRWYEQRITECGGIDLQILGIGHDGEIAGNEAGSSLGARTRLKTLPKPFIDDHARFFEDPDDVPTYAITVGIGTIQDARQLLLMANGEHKADAVAAAIEGPVTSMCTGSVVQLHPKVVVLLDRPAASKLKMIDYYEWIQAKKPGAPRV